MPNIGFAQYFPEYFVAKCDSHTGRSCLGLDEAYAKKNHYLLKLYFPNTHRLLV